MWVFDTFVLTCAGVPIFLGAACSSISHDVTCNIFTWSRHVKTQTFTKRLTLSRIQQYPMRQHVTSSLGHDKDFNITCNIKTLLFLLALSMNINTPAYSTHPTHFPSHITIQLCQHIIQHVLSCYMLVLHINAVVSACSLIEH